GHECDNRWINNDAIVPHYDLFFQCSRPYPALHFFPTRRSSDLLTKSATTSNRPISKRGGRPPISMPSSASAWRSARPNVSPSVRSEEHTSELQSQSNLVCRLLLEKKNKQKGNSDTLVRPLRTNS